MAHAGTAPFLIAEPSAPGTSRAVPLHTFGPVFEDERLLRKFIDEDRILTLRNVRTLCWIAIVLMITAVVLDYFAYPQLLGYFFFLRLSCAACLVPVLYLIRKPFGQLYYRAFTVIVPMIPALFISLMIKASRDPGSSYYAGLTLCLVAIGFMFHWTFMESAVALVLTILFYFSANAWVIWEGLPLSSIAAFVNNAVFILLNGVVIIAGSFYHHRIRVREFMNRIEIEQQREELTSRNTELTNTLKQLRETEHQLVQSEKLVSLGRMSAGIIHEINNPLNFANQALFVLKKKARWLPDTERENFERIVGDVRDGIGRVSAIVSDLRSFAHPDKAMQQSLVDLAEAVQHTARIMAAPLKDAGVDLHITMPSPLFLIGDSNQLTQILINLVQNAIDALRGSEQPVITLVITEQGDHIDLSVTDNGCGIPPENVEHIFDPFFTTKGVGEGMGMGLSVCYRLMHQMHGTITLSSQPGEGTTFTLRFPTPIS